LNFAKAELTEVLNSNTPGSKQKKAGLGVSAAVNFNVEKNQLELVMQFSNQSGGPISEFDLMINKNSFGVGPDAPCSKHGITYPAAFQTSDVQVLPLKIDKKNADVKSPPKSPFTLQLALKSSLDIFYFNVPCELHSLIGREANQKLSKDEFKKFWDSLGQEKTFTMDFGGMSQLKLYQGFQSVAEDITSCLENNGFV
jgi:hypothetical protein